MTINVLLLLGNNSVFLYQYILREKNRFICKQNACLMRANEKKKFFNKEKRNNNLIIFNFS
jgi:hypothetical protein